MFADKSAVARPEPLLIAERYRILDLLGRGGMGAVYTAHDPVAKKDVALKLLGQGADEKSLAMFEREYYTLASLKHPRIVEVYEYGRSQEGAFYTMELLQGGDLSQTAPMPWREVCACLREVASVLGVLHLRNLVHRDLSPRNLWRTREGKLKLIDFGALANFGPSQNVVGTAPFVPPEALRGLALDGRTDLYALGALAYWLLTSVHAYPAKSLGELHVLWTREPAGLLDLMRVLPHADADPPPPGLEELISSLLRLEPEKRVASTAELIDRLTTLADLPADTGGQSAQGYLESKVFVGRSRERERLLGHVSEAEGGQAGSLVVEAPSGLGRTRLLTEMAILTRVAGMNTVWLETRGRDRAYGVVEALLDHFIVSSPEAMEAAARVELIAALSPRLARGKKTVLLSAMSSAEHVRLQEALQEWLLALTKDRALALFIDNLDAVDDESLAFLNLLARAERGHKLLLVSSVAREGTTELSPLLQSLRNVSASVRLLPLTRIETRQLVQSVFGAVPYVERLAERFYRLSEGNPSHCLTLCQHLVEVGAARYVDGLWVLPTDLATANLPKSRTEGIVARLTRISAEARALARKLSAPHIGVFSPEICRELTGGADSPLFTELCEHNVLTSSASGYEPAHEALREALWLELSVAQRQVVHRELAEALMKAHGEERLARLNAGVHFMQAGDITRGQELHVTTLRDCIDVGEFYRMRREMPLVEQGLELLRANGRDQYALAFHLTTLACCAFHIDRRLQLRHGQEVQTAFEHILKLKWGLSLRRYLGARLSLVVMLIAAGIGIARRGRYGFNLAMAIRYLFFSMSSMSGVAAVCLDAPAIRRYAKTVEPLAALGKNHVANFVHEYMLYLALRVEDHPAASSQQAEQILRMLRTPGQVKGMPEGARINYLAAALFSHAISESWRDGPRALALADEVSSMSPFYSMCADHLRAGFYSCQGNMVEAQRHRQLVERQAIQLGSAWQLETWAPADLLKSASLTHDALALKRSAQELERLCEELPSMNAHLRAARGGYLLLRGKYQEAIAVLNDDSEPLAIAGWMRMRGKLAAAHNALGAYQRAKAICEDVIARQHPDDGMFPAQVLVVELELVIACAGLGEMDAAKARLDALLALHEPGQGPLTMGAVHDAYVRVALLAQDFESCDKHLSALKSWHLPLNVPSLLERIEALSHELIKARRVDAPNADGPLLGNDTHLITRVQLVLTQSGELMSERARKALQVAVELSGADDGFLVSQRGTDNEPLASLAVAPSPELFQWARARLLAAYANDETAAVEDVNSLIDLNLHVEEGVRYCVAPLWARVGHEEVVVAAVALGFRSTVPKLPAADVLRVIASSLVEGTPNSQRMESARDVG